MSKDLSAKYYQDNKERLLKNLGFWDWDWRVRQIAPMLTTPRRLKHIIPDSKSEAEQD